MMITLLTLLSNPIVISQPLAYVIGSIFLFIQGVMTVVIPLIFKYMSERKQSHIVERALPMIGQLKNRVELIRNTLDADRVAIWYFSNGEDYYTGNPVQYCTILDEKLNPVKPKLKTMLTAMTRVPISYYYRDLKRLHNKDYFTSMDDTIIQDELSQLNAIYSIVSNNVFKISITRRIKSWKFWQSKVPLWVGTINIAYDHPYQMTEGEVAFVKTQLLELAHEILLSDKT